jgi:repressor of nif and glnA expression
MREARTPPDMERKLLAILRVLAESDGPVGARAIAGKLAQEGIELSERTVRYHLRLMDERGLTRNLGEPGRVITERGREEIESGGVSDKIGFIISKIDTLAYQSTFNMDTNAGEIILNISYLPESQFRQALDIMADIFRAGYCMSELVHLRGPGEEIDGVPVPPGMVGFGTVCTVTLNRVLLSRGIPVDSKYAGLLEIHRDIPSRFTHLVAYAGTTADPTELFIGSKMTSVREAALRGHGRILASFREVPAAAEHDLLSALDIYRHKGLKGIMGVGKAGQPLLSVPVTVDRIGIAVVAGLTPIAAVAEAGIPVQNKAMSALIEVSELKPVYDL